MTLRELTADDVGWAAELMERRRQVYARYSPVFWRPAANATGLHARFLGRQAGAAGNVALRTDRGFIIAQCRAAEGFVDDFAVDGDDAWATDGAELLLAAAGRLAAEGGPDQVRVVTAHADEPKVAMLAGLSLRLVEQWWVREPTAPGTAAPDAAVPGAAGASLAPAELAGPGVAGPGVAQSRAAGPVSGPGFAGIFGPAPPVYDPGGPVLLASRVDADADVAVIAREAAALGAVLAIAAAPPGTALSRALDQQGWSVASDWYTGRPVPAPSGRRTPAAADAESLVARIRA
jgi:hypothetical protein